MKDIMKDLEQKKKLIQDLKDKKARLEGKREQLMSDLKKHGCETIEEADKLLDEMNAKLDKMETKINTKYEALEENYSWD